MNITIQILDLMTRGLTNGIRGIFDIKIVKISFKSILDLLNIETKIDHTQEGNMNKIPPNNIKGKIELKNVYFRYPVNLNESKQKYIKNENSNQEINEKRKYILKNISFTINPGEKVALIGHSGSGKSTLIKLLERFYEPDRGEILFDGINIKNYNFSKSRTSII